MKKTIAFTLCAALVLAPMQETKATNILAICLIGAAAVAGGVVVFLIKTCKPKYYCVQDEDGNRFPSNATRTERAANDWKVKSGPYRSAEEAAAACPPKTNSPAGLVMMAGLNNGEDEIFIPQMTLKVWKSSDLVNWAQVDTILDDPDHFSWTDTNAISGASQAFYRVSY